MLDREQLQRREGRDHARNFSAGQVAWAIRSNVIIHLITLIELKHGIEPGSSENGIFILWQEFYTKLKS